LFGVVAHAYRGFVAGLAELNNAICKCEYSEIFTQTNIFARVEFGATLPYNNVSGNSGLAAKDFYAKSFALGVAVILYAAFTFFVCHLVFFSGLCTKIVCCLRDFADADAREILTVAVAFLVAFAALFLEDDYFIAFQVVQDLDSNGSAATHFDIAFGAAHQHFIERYLIAAIAAEAVYKQLLVLTHFELLAGYVYDCEHDL